MTDTTTWVVLSDGKYIKILFNNGSGNKLRVLNADKHQVFAELCYKIVNNKDRGDTSVARAALKQDYIQLQVDFLTAQLEQRRYDRLVLVAPQDVIDVLRSRLPEQVSNLVVTELAEDLLPTSNDDIEIILADKVSA